MMRFQSPLVYLAREGFFFFLALESFGIKRRLQLFHTGLGLKAAVKD